MIFESYSWKQDLIRRRYLIKKYNTQEHLDKNYDRATTIIEKAVFYSAFIIRKLIDCILKVSDEVDNYTLKVHAVKPLKQIGLLDRWPDENSHDWGNAQQQTVLGKNVCNWLIHSYVFYFSYNENDVIDSFYVASDYDRNKILYRIDLNDWLEYMYFVGTDCITSAECIYNPAKSNYVLKFKKRWNSLK